MNVMQSQAELLTIYNANREELVRFSVSITGDLALAEDVLQEAWLKFVRAAAAQHFDEPIAYLRTVVRSLSIDTRRRIQRESERVNGESVDALNVADQDGAGSEQTLMMRSDLILLQRAVSELPEKTQSALQLYWQDGNSLRDIAAILGISLGQAHSLVKDGLEHCRRRLNRMKTFH